MTNYFYFVEVTTEWSEEGVKICMGPLLTLLPVNSQLLKECVNPLYMIHPHNMTIYGQTQRFGLVNYYNY